MAAGEQVWQVALPDYLQSSGRFGVLLQAFHAFALPCRLLVLAVSFVLARLGIHLSVRELRWLSIRGLVLQLKKVREMQV